MQTQVGSHDDHRTARVVHAFAEKILPETSLLSFEHVAQRLEGTFVRSRDDLTSPPVIEQDIHRFLEHPLLIANDDVRSLEIEKAFKPVVAIDDPAIQIVQVRRRESSSVQRHERPQIGGEHRDGIHNQPIGTVLRFAEGVDDLQPFCQFLPFGFRLRPDHLDPERIGQFIQFQGPQHDLYRLGADSRLEPVPEILPGLQQLFVREDRASHERRILRIHDDIALEIQDSFEILQGEVEQIPHLRGEALEEPDVGDGRGQFDVAHPLTADLRLDHLDTAFLAHDSAVLHPFVLAAVTLVVLDGPENLGTEQPVSLGLEGPVIDCFGLLDFPERPFPNLLRGCQRYSHRVETRRILRLGKETVQFFQCHSPSSAHGSCRHLWTGRTYSRLQ